MKNTPRLLSGTAMVLSYCAFLFCFFALTYLENRCLSMSLSPLPPIVYLLAVWFLDAFLAKKNCPLSVFVGLQLALAAGFIYLLLRCAVMEPFHLGSAIFLSIFAAGGVFACAYAAEESPGQKNLTFYFDSVITLMIILLLADHFLPMFLVPQVLTVSAAALAVNMAALASGHRAAGERRLGLCPQKLLPAILVGVILLLAALFVIFAATGTQSLSLAIWQAMQAVGRALWAVGAFFMKQLEAFLRWLITFLPDPGSDVMEGDAMAIPGGDGSVSGGSVRIPRYLYYIAGGVGAALLLKFLLSMLHERAGGTEKDSFPLADSRRSAPESTGKRLLREVLEHIRYLILRFRLRNTAPGLLLWCQRHTPKELRRAPGESGPAFLRRLGARLSMDSLAELAGVLEVQFYAPSGACAPMGRAAARLIKRDFSRKITSKALDNPPVR